MEYNELIHGLGDRIEVAIKKKYKNICTIKFTKPKLSSRNMFWKVKATSVIFFQFAFTLPHILNYSARACLNSMIPIKIF